MTFAEALKASELIWFLLPSGQVLTRLTRDIDKPPSIAEAWRIESQGEWCYDLGGQWIETGKGKMVWEPRA